MENHRCCNGSAALEETHHRRMALEQSGDGLRYYLGVMDVARVVRTLLRAVRGSGSGELPAPTRVRGLF